MDIESSGLSALAGAVTTALAGAAVKLFGSKQERSDDRAAATAEWRKLADQARADLDKCSENTRRMDERIDQMRNTVATIEGHYVALQIEHATCPARIAELETKVRQLERKSDPPEAA